MKYKIKYLLYVSFMSLQISGDGTLQAIFTHIYTQEIWGCKNINQDESVSGIGSRISSTQIIRMLIPALITTLPVHSLLDIPCGDWHWMKETALGDIQYIGADIVPDIIEQNQQRYGNLKRNFLVLDATQDALPYADLILCRDCLAHLSFENILRALKNFKRSGAKYLLVSNFNGCGQNRNIINGDFHPLNLLLPPFNLPQPLIAIDELSPENPDRYFNKHIFLWELSSLNLDAITLQ